MIFNSLWEEYTGVPWFLYYGYFLYHYPICHIYSVFSTGIGVVPYIEFTVFRWIGIRLWYYIISVFRPVLPSVCSGSDSYLRARTTLPPTYISSAASSSFTSGGQHVEVDSVRVEQDLRSCYPYQSCYLCLHVIHDYAWSTRLLLWHFVIEKLR